MAGGVWRNQNKVRPGVYINFKNAKTVKSALGERGTVTIPVILPWAKEKTLITIDNEMDDDLFDTLGLDLNHDSTVILKEALKRARKLIIYRLNEGTKATATAESLVVTAKYSGTRGNDILVTIQPNVDEPSKFDVTTIIDGKTVDKQLASNIEELKGNKFVEFLGTGKLKAVAAIHLANGSDGTVANEAYMKYLEAIEVIDFNTVALPVKDNTLKGMFVEFVKRVRENDGKKIQLVVENYQQADYEGVISVKNGVILKDKSVITPERATAWVAAATASAAINESLTYSQYDGAVDVYKKYTHKEIETALRSGEVVFSLINNKVVVEQDINTFLSFDEIKGKDFRKNRVIRVLDGIANDLRLQFEKFFIGKIANNEDGRNLLKAEIIKYLDELQELSAIDNFDAQKDIEVHQGMDKDAVVVNLMVQPVDSIEKIYMTVEVK